MLIPTGVFVFRISLNCWSFFCQINLLFRIYPKYSCLILINGSMCALFELNLNIIVRNNWLIFARSLWNNIFCKVILCNKSCILIIFCVCNKLRTPSVIASFLFVIVYASYFWCSKSNIFIWINKEYSCICCCSLAVQVKSYCYVTCRLIWWVTWVWNWNYIITISILGSVSCICCYKFGRCFIKFWRPFFIIFFNCKSSLSLNNRFC